MERSLGMTYPTKVDLEAGSSKLINRVLINRVLQLVQKDRALLKEQADFCDDACVLRYLKACGNNVQRAAKMLRSTLKWREKTDIGYLIADEFPTELAAGAAYVAGHDIEGRPVLVIKKKPKYILKYTHKQYLRFITFTLEVTVAALPRGVDQWVLILDVGGYSTLSGFSTSGILNILKMLADYYPGRLAKAFIVDASSRFYYVWKGLCTIVDRSSTSKLTFACSKNYRSILEPQRTSKISLLSSPFSKHFRRWSSSFRADNTKLPIPFRSKAASADYAPIFGTSPKWTEDDEVLDRLSEGPKLASRMTRVSYSFSCMTGSIMCSSLDRAEEELFSFRKDNEDNVSELEIPASAPTQIRRSKFPSRDSLVSIFQPAMRNDSIRTEEVKHRDVDLFLPYLRFLQASYDEAAYRALMKPPLGGLATIVSGDLNRSLHVCVHTFRDTVARA